MLECQFNKKQKKTPMYSLSANKGDKMKHWKAIWPLRQHFVKCFVLWWWHPAPHVFTPLQPLWEPSSCCKATWWARPGKWPTLTKNSLVGEKRSHSFPVQFSPDTAESCTSTRGEEGDGRRVQRQGCWSRCYSSDIHQPNPKWGSDDHKGSTDMW